MVENSIAGASKLPQHLQNDGGSQRKTGASHRRTDSDLMDSLVDAEVFDSDRFERKAVERYWKNHIEGIGDFSSALDFLATYGCVFR